MIKSKIYKLDILQQLYTKTSIKINMHVKKTDSDLK